MRIETRGAAQTPTPQPAERPMDQELYKDFKVYMTARAGEIFDKAINRLYGEVSMAYTGRVGSLAKPRVEFDMRRMDATAEYRDYPENGTDAPPEHIIFCRPAYDIFEEMAKTSDKDYRSSLALVLDTVIGHELGHELVDNAISLTGAGEFPDNSINALASNYDVMGIRRLMESMAELIGVYASQAANNHGTDSREIARIMLENRAREAGGYALLARMLAKGKTADELGLSQADIDALVEGAAESIAIYNYPELGMASALADMANETLAAFIKEVLSGCMTMHGQIGRYVLGEGGDLTGVQEALGARTWNRDGTLNVQPAANDAELKARYEAMAKYFSDIAERARDALGRI